MFRTVMVPLDGSPLAEQALPLAAAIAQRMGAWVVLVQVVPLPTAPLVLEGVEVSVAEQVERMADVAREYLTAKQQALTACLAGPPAGNPANPARTSFHVLVGEAAPVLADYADSAGVDLIVMATHGQSGVSRWAFGSVADKLLQLSHAPLIALRPNEADSPSLAQLPPLETILVPLDGSELAEQILPLVTPLARSFDAELCLFRVAVPLAVFAMSTDVMIQATLWDLAEQEACEYLETVGASLSKEGLRVRLLTGVTPIADAILRMAEEYNVGLIAMTTHGRTGLRRVVFGSVADRVLRAGHRPVLILRPPAEA
jgi:nucleotide-binding universal stress UspA family protein